MSPLPAWLSIPPPDAAVEISAEQVSVAVVTSRGGSLTVAAHGAEPLPPGVVVPALAAANITDGPGVAAALTVVFDRLSIRPRRVALVIPDSAAKLSLVRFDHIPSRRDDLDQLVRWHVRKSTPFPIDEACVTYNAGSGGLGAGKEFLVSLARRSVIGEYEGVCEAAGAQAGIVDVATVSLVNMFLGSSAAPEGDWLLVHVRADSTSVVIMRDGDLIFFRNRTDSEQESVATLVQQTTMYYQDRLSGGSFTRVMVGGLGRGSGAVELVRRSIEDRLGVSVEAVNPTAVAQLTDRIDASPEVMDRLGPLVGISKRGRARGAAA